MCACAYVFVGWASSGYSHTQPAAMLMCLSQTQLLVYDKKTHERLTKSAFDFTSSFADECAQARLRGEPMPSLSGGTSASSSSSSSSQPNGSRGGGAHTPRGGRGGRGGRGERSGRGRGRWRGRGRSKETPAPPNGPPLSASPDVEGLIGTTVRRIFGDTWFEGVVSRDQNGHWYTVTYTDGDKEDLSALELRFIADGVCSGARIRFNGGPKDGGWDSGTVIEPYEKKHGKLWVPKGYEGQASAAHSWLVHFQTGVAPVALPNERKVEEQGDSPPGSWMSIDEFESQK